MSYIKNYHSDIRYSPITNSQLPNATNRQTLVVKLEVACLDCSWWNRTKRTRFYNVSQCSSSSSRRLYNSDVVEFAMSFEVDVQTDV